MKRIRLVLIALVCIALAGCGTVPSGTEDVNISGSNTPSVSGIKEPEEIELPAELVSGTVTGNYDCTIALQDDASTVSGTGASVQGNVVTITAGGKYLITGSLSNGQLIVDSADAEKVRITLNGVSINCQDSAAIYIKNAEKTILELAQGSVNIVQDGSTYNLAEGQDEPSACIFSKDDIKSRVWAHCMCKATTIKEFFLRMT